MQTTLRLNEYGDYDATSGLPDGWVADGRCTCLLVKTADIKTLDEMGIGHGECSLPFIQASVRIHEERKQRLEERLNSLLVDDSVDDEAFAEGLAELGLKEV